MSVFMFDCLCFLILFVSVFECECVHVCESYLSNMYLINDICKSVFVFNGQRKRKFLFVVAFECVFNGFCACLPSVCNCLQVFVYISMFLSV